MIDLGYGGGCLSGKEVVLGIHAATLSFARAPGPPSVAGRSRLAKQCFASRFARPVRTPRPASGECSIVEMEAANWR